MDDTLKEVMNVFNKHFQPATDFSESDELKTTEEIFEMFNDLIQDDIISIKSVYMSLKDSGFVFDIIQDEFKWLLKRIK